MNIYAHNASNKRKWGLKDVCETLLLADLCNKRYIKSFSEKAEKKHHHQQVIYYIKLEQNKTRRYSGIEYTRALLFLSD